MELFKGRHFDREIIVLCVRWYLRYKLSFRDLVEMITLDGYQASHRAAKEALDEHPEGNQCKILIEQDHRSVKLRLGPTLGLKHFRQAATTIAGIELMHRILRSKIRALGFRLGELIEGAERMACIHRDRTGAHVDRHAERLQHFLARGAAVDRRLGVEGNAIVAARRDRDRERDQLFRLDVERARRERGLRDPREALHHVACAGAQMAQFAAEMLGQSGPVVRSHVSLLSSEKRAAQAPAVAGISSSLSHT